VSGCLVRLDCRPEVLRHPLHYVYHDLRHGTASLLTAQGIHPRTIMEILGHSTIAVTMNTYAHVAPALQREAASSLDAVLGSA
jgi:integrase